MLESSRSEDTLHPGAGTTGSWRVGDPGPSQAPGSGANAHHSPALLGALERVMYRAQWLLIDEDNRCVDRPLRSLTALRRGLTDGTAATAAARLVDGVLAADIDIDDPIIGDAIAEALVAWCVKHDLPYLIRDSGRAGGRHVITAITHHRVDPREWRSLCRQLADSYREHGAVVDDRTGKALRLLTAPHRLGRPTRVLACTLAPAHVLDARALHIARPQRGRRSGATKQKRGGRGSRVSSSRSEKEFGVTLVLARQGYTIDEAWTELHLQLPESAKSFEQGRDWWERYVWLIALTVVAAEQGHTPEHAWELVERDGLADCGREWWDDLWTLKLDEAAMNRPRATLLPGQLPPSALESADKGEEQIMLRGLHRAVEAALPTADPRRRRSVLIILCALVPALLVREGSMSIRAISVRGGVHTSTVQTAIATAVAHKLLVITTRYAGGSKACQSYALGEAALPHIEAARESSPHTSCSTPAPTGSANIKKLKRRYTRDRKAWTPRCDLMESLASGERLATSQHPTAKLLRSRWAQKTWWTTQTPEQQEHRRSARRAVLAALHHTTRRRWFDWLNERSEIDAAADRFTARTATAADMARLAQPPIAYHRGLLAPDWDRRRANVGSQLTLAA